MNQPVGGDLVTITTFAMTVAGRVMSDNGKPGLDKWVLSVCAPGDGKYGFLWLIDQRDAKGDPR